MTGGETDDDQHRREHDEQREALKLARELHQETHKVSKEALKTALDAVASERKIHAEAHDREHIGHLEIHRLNNLAIEKAESANDKRFTAANGFRETFEARVRDVATKDALEAQRKESDRRINILERNDVKAEGRGLGQGAVIAYIVSGVSVIGSLIVLANLLYTR